MNPTVLFESQHYLALFKPAGLPTSPRSSSPDDSDCLMKMALGLRPSLNQLISVSHHSYEPGLIHRLDPTTSGVVLFAKTEAGFLHARKLWKSHEIEKKYRALVTSTLDPGHSLKSIKLPHSIRFPIGHSNKSDKKMVAILEEKHLIRIRGQAREAHTELLSLNTSDKPQQLIASLRLYSGQRHQIRVHLAALGFPILGDTLYGGGHSSRIWLHAESLTFNCPDGETVSIVAPAW